MRLVGLKTPHPAMMGLMNKGDYMNAIRSVLLVIDPTVEHDPACDRALFIAKKTGASVRLFINNENTLTSHSYVYEGVDGSFFENQRRLFEEHYRKILANTASHFLAEGVQVSVHFAEQHHLAEAIISETSTCQPDLVIKSTHHHNRLERSLISNTDWRLIRKCPAPLLLVKPGEWQEGGVVVTAVDPLHSKSEQAKLDRVLLDATIQISTQLKLKPSVFHSYFPFVSTLFPLETETSEHLERIKSHHRDALMELLSGYDIDPQDVELSAGDLSASLVQFLKRKQANLLIIGALSRNVLERAIVGNTAERILEGSPCDVLVLKS